MWGRDKDSDKWKTTFHTKYGFFKWLVIPKGLTNTAVAFQWFMNDIFSDMLDICMVVYLNNILIYSSDMATYCKQKSSNAFGRMASMQNPRNANSTRIESSIWATYIFTLEGLLTASSDKVKVIQDWPNPWKVKDIQSFLGFANFYCHFIYNFSNIVILLTCLICKPIPFIAFLNLDQIVSMS